MSGPAAPRDPDPGVLSHRGDVPLWLSCRDRSILQMIRDAAKHGESDEPFRILDKPLFHRDGSHRPIDRLRIGSSRVYALMYNWKSLEGGGAEMRPERPKAGRSE